MIELLIVVALVAVVLTLAAPSFGEMLKMQRLRGTNAQLITDLQFGRAEAVARREFLRVFFKNNDNFTCYTLYTSTDNETRCDCLAGPGAACAGNTVEVRTVRLERSAGVMVNPPATQLQQGFAFDWRTGSLYAIPTDNDPRPISQFTIETYIDGPRKLATRLNQAGRPLVCKPAGSSMTETAC